MIAQEVIIEYSQNGRLVDTLPWLNLDRAVVLESWPGILARALGTAANLVAAYGCGRADIIGIHGVGRTVLASCEC